MILYFTFEKFGDSQETWKKGTVKINAAEVKTSQPLVLSMGQAPKTLDPTLSIMQFDIQ